MSKHIAASGANQGKWVKCKATVETCQLGAHIENKDLHAIKFNHTATTGERIPLGETPSTAVAAFLLSTDEEKEELRTKYNTHLQASRAKRAERDERDKEAVKTLTLLAKNWQLVKEQQETATAVLKELDKPYIDQTNDDTAYARKVKKAVQAHIKDEDGRITKNILIGASYRRLLVTQIEKSGDDLPSLVRLDINTERMNSLLTLIEYQRATSPEARREVFMRWMEKMNAVGAEQKIKLDERRKQAAIRQQAQEKKDKRKAKLKRFFGLPK